MYYECTALFLPAKPIVAHYFKEKQIDWQKGGSLSRKKKTKSKPRRVYRVEYHNKEGLIY